MKRITSMNPIEVRVSKRATNHTLIAFLAFILTLLDTQSFNNLETFNKVGIPIAAVMEVSFLIYVIVILGMVSLYRKFTYPEKLSVQSNKVVLYIGFITVTMENCEVMLNTDLNEGERSIFEAHYKVSRQIMVTALIAWFLAPLKMGVVLLLKVALLWCRWLGGPRRARGGQSLEDAAARG